MNHLWNQMLWGGALLLTRTILTMTLQYLCVLKAPPLASSTPIQRVEPTVVSCVKRPGPSAAAPVTSVLPPPQPPTTTAKTKSQPKIIPSTRNEPIGLNVADFLPVSLTFTLFHVLQFCTFFLRDEN